MDAFVRSGLSFAVAAFRLAQEPRPTSIAHHAHMPASLIHAVRLDLPTMLLVRAPKDAVLSYVIKTPSVSIHAGLRGYVRFHRPLLPYLERIVVATFEQVMNDYGVVIDRINERFSTSFIPFSGTDANLGRIRGEIEDDWLGRARSDEERERGIPRPSHSRARHKAVLQHEYEAAMSAPIATRSHRLFEALRAAAGER